MTVAHERRGSGDPLVLIHGIGSRKEAWAPAAEIVAAEREVIGVDLPGFGESAGADPGPLTIRRHATEMAERIEGLGLERPHVAGNSMGGAIALELARLGAVGSVIAFSPVGFQGALSNIWERAILRGTYAGAKLDPRGPSGWRMGPARAVSFLTAYGRPFRVPAEELRHGNASLAGSTGFMDALPGVARYRLEDPEELRPTPVTIAWGRRDVLLNWYVQSRRARRALPWATHVDLPRCGHVPFYDDPALCARVMLEGSGG